MKNKFFFICYARPGDRTCLTSGTLKHLNNHYLLYRHYLSGDLDPDRPERL